MISVSNETVCQLFRYWSVGTFTVPSTHLGFEPQIHQHLHHHFPLLLFNGVPNDLVTPKSSLRLNTGHKGNQSLIHPRASFQSPHPSTSRRVGVKEACVLPHPPPECILPLTLPPLPDEAAAVLAAFLPPLSFRAFISKFNFRTTEFRDSQLRKVCLSSAAILFSHTSCILDLTLVRFRRSAIEISPVEDGGLDAI